MAILELEESVTHHLRNEMRVWTTGKFESVGGNRNEN